MAQGSFGYDKMTIHPVGVGVAGSTNNAASCSIKTPRGAASSSWVGPAITATGTLAQRSTKTVQLNATVPVGSLSTIRVPLVKAAGQKIATTTITEGGKVVWQIFALP